MIGVLRQLLAARPFRPFRLVLTGGWESPVTAADRMTFTDGETVRVEMEDGKTHIVDLRHLVEIRSWLEQLRKGSVWTSARIRRQRSGA